MSEKTNPATPRIEDGIVVFQEKMIRRTWHQNEWWFSVQNVVAVLADSPNPTDYIKKMRLRDKELAQGWGQLVTPFRLETEGGVQRGNCANKELETKSGVPVVSRTNYLSAPEGATATAEDSSAVLSEQGLISDAATVSKTGMVGGGRRNPTTAQKKLAEKSERKRSGRKK